ncbi:MAG: hypothetical protein ABMA64_09830 [Myxococcota bacterium]
MFTWLVACGHPEPASVDPCDDRGDRSLYVVQSLWFARGAGGVSEGFDLDGVDGPAGGCAVSDWVAPDGAAGIDNAFASLLPALELTEAAAVEGLIQTAIASGELLITVELSEVDDPADDACVDLAIGRALGPPILGTDGKVLSGSTFDPDPEIDPVVATDVPLAEGVFEMPVELSLPLQIFDVSLQFELLDGRFRGVMQPDGTLTGVFAGGVDTQAILAVTEEENVDSGLHDVVQALLDAWADLAPDGAGGCGQISMAFTFTAVPAFWYR